MRGRTSFETFDDFRNEVLRLRTGPLTSAVDEIVDDLFRVDADEEMDSSWEDIEEE
jgi:hypothetical protein